MAEGDTAAALAVFAAKRQIDRRNAIERPVLEDRPISIWSTREWLEAQWMPDWQHVGPQVVQFATEACLECKSRGWPIYVDRAYEPVSAREDVLLAPHATGMAVRFAYLFAEPSPEEWDAIADHVMALARDMRIKVERLGPSTYALQGWQTAVHRRPGAPFRAMLGPLRRAFKV